MYSVSFRILIDGFITFFKDILCALKNLVEAVLFCLAALVIALACSLCDLLSICKRYRVVSTLIAIIVILATMLFFSIVRIWHLQAEQDSVELQMVNVIHQNDSLRHAEVKFTKHAMR